jgi:hypothetical protein
MASKSFGLHSDSTTTRNWDKRRQKPRERCRGQLAIMRSPSAVPLERSVRLTPLSPHVPANVPACPRNNRSLRRGFGRLNLREKASLFRLGEALPGRKKRDPLLRE